MSLRSPSESLVSDSPPDEVEVVEDTVSDGPSLGPVLYLGYRDGVQATLVPVAEIRPEGLFPIESIGSVEASRSFVAEHLTPGLEFTLFSDGAQVGSLSAEVFSVDERYCRVRPQIRGHIELTPAAADGPEISRRSGARGARARIRPLLSCRPDHRPSEHLTQDGAAGHSRRRCAFARRCDRHPTGHPDVSGPARCYADRGRYVRIRRRSRGRPPRPVGHTRSSSPPTMTTEPVTGVLMWTTECTSRDGKGAARYFDHLDIDGDGSDEVVLEVMGEGSMWLSTLTRQGRSLGGTVPGPMWACFYVFRAVNSLSRRARHALFSNMVPRGDSGSAATHSLANRRPEELTSPRPRRRATPSNWSTPPVRDTLSRQRPGGSFLWSRRPRRHSWRWPWPTNWSAERTTTGCRSSPGCLP